MNSDANVPPMLKLIEIATAPFVSKIVYTAAKLGLADQLAGGARSAEELAAPMGLDVETLHRFMRTLAGLGILTEGAGQRFSLTPTGEELKSGAPGCARSMFLTVGGAAFTRAFDELEYSLQTGKPGFDHSAGMPIFDYLGKHPDEAQRFSETMVSFHGMEPPAVAAAYDFGASGTIVDVGGATGNLLASILETHAAARGILFDMPHVVRAAPALLKARGVESRVSIESGSFFDSVPAGGDAYVMSHIIHDWSEAQCLTILGNCRKAMKASAKLLLVEMVLPEGDVPHPGKILDMMMLVVPGGRERTPAEYSTLLGKAGFKLSRIVPTQSPVSIVEAIPG
jgi:hypothetical protein